MSRSLLLVAAASAVTFATLTNARAQEVLVQGPGVKVGESTVLQPRVGLEAGAVSNVFYEDSDETLSTVLRLLAGIDVAPGARRRLGSDDVGAPSIDFNLGVELQYQEYLSNREAVRAQRNLDADAHGGVTFNPEGKLAFEIADRFSRLARPTNFESSRQLTRDRNHFLAEARIQPGGRTLKVGLRYENVIDVFESETAEFADRLQHTIGLKGTWKFFPYSQTWLDASIGFFGPLGDSEIDGMPYKVSSNPLRIIAGLDTLITPLTTVKAYAGYARGFYSEGPSYHAPVFGVDVGWRYVPLGRLKVGYAYEVQDSVNANYYAEHHAHASVAHAIQRVYLSAGPGLRFRTYEGVPMVIAPDDVRKDLIFEMAARAEYLLQERFSVYLTAATQAVETEFRDRLGDDPSFFRLEAIVGAVAAF